MSKVMYARKDLDDNFIWSCSARETPRLAMLEAQGNGGGAYTSCPFEIVAVTMGLDGKYQELPMAASLVEGQAREGEGKKYDAGKASWHLFPFMAARVVVEVLRFGANKYGDRNWEAGMDYSRLFGAAIRHLTSWFDGEDVDSETGLSHLAHATCCLLFLLTYTITGKGTDDRPKSAGN